MLKLYYYAKLGNVLVGPKYPVRIVGVLNLSPESFYPESVARDLNDAIERAIRMVNEGADIIDVGGMSTAPYKETYISLEEELNRVRPVIKELSKTLEVPISIDTRRSRVAEEALKAGAEIVNDTSGFKLDPDMARIVREYNASAIVMAYGDVSREYDPIVNIRRLIRESLEICMRYDIDLNKIVIDPGIGFFRDTWLPWYDWDTYVISNLYRLKILGRPILIGISMKSFIGKILSLEEPRERLYGSIASEALAVFNGADAIRTHNVTPTLHAVRMAEHMRRKIKSYSSMNVSITDITDIWAIDDIREMLIDLDVDRIGVDIMSGKGVFKILYISNIPRILALVIKQEMLAVGGDSATPKETILGGLEPADILVFGTINQLNKLISKLKLMRFKILDKYNLINGPELAKLIENAIA